MAKTRKTKRPVSQVDSFDGVYLLKLVLYLLLGSVWLKISKSSTMGVPIPVGLIVGLIFTLHEHFQIDRKIEYAVLLVAMLFGYFAPYGLYVTL
jgi:hypothetical protein